MDIFIDGSFIDYQFETSAGCLRVGADVRIVGETLELIEPLVCSTDDEILQLGVRHILELGREIKVLARLQGFTRLIVTGHRVSGATPGRSVYLERRVRG